MIKQFLDENQKELKEIVTLQLIHRTSCEIFDRRNDNNKHEIENYEDWPVWVLMELLSLDQSHQFLSILLWV